MSLSNKLYSFLKSFFYQFTKNSKEICFMRPTIKSLSNGNVIEQISKSTQSLGEEDKVSVARRTLLTKLYFLEQEIIVWENDFPSEHQAFMARIENLRETYNSSLENSRELLTFEIDPEIDSEKTVEILRLERDVKRFIEKDVKFNIISKRLQRLIMKLNILYNVSIFHSKEHEKEKVNSRLKSALETATGIVCEFKECDYILNDNQLKERIISLISYVDYEIFKASVRNSKATPSELINNLIMLAEFSGFDFVSAFMAFIKDEISDLGEFLPLITDDECRRAMGEKLSKLITCLTYSDDVDNLLLDTSFWDSFLSFESCLLEMLKASGVEKEKAKVDVIKRMDISLEESDVLVLPITTTHLSLIELYSKTQDNRILLMIKLLSVVSNNISYKEIYFLLLLFELGDVIENTPNELFRHVRKYFERYPYDSETIEKKKKDLINSFNKEYVVTFDLNDYENGIITTLESLNIDFKIESGKVLINSFYFNGLENVLPMTKSMTI